MRNFVYFLIIKNTRGCRIDAQFNTLRSVREFARLNLKRGRFYRLCVYDRSVDRDRAVTPFHRFISLSVFYKCISDCNKLAISNISKNIMFPY